MASGILPGLGIPLIIQDKSFIDTRTVLKTDPPGPSGLTPAIPISGRPDVYMTNQNPNSDDGANAMGRWDYGPWFWPPWPVANPPIQGVGDMTITNGGSGYTLPPIVTITPAVGDSGTGAKASAKVDASGKVVAIEVNTRGTGYTKAQSVTITAAPGDTTGSGATATATSWWLPNVPDNYRPWKRSWTRPWSTAPPTPT